MARRARYLLAPRVLVVGLSVLLAGLSVGPAVAQGAGPGAGLGSSPGGTPAATPAGARLVEISQLGAGDQTIGQPVQTVCPSTGCQTNLQLTIEGQAEPFLLSVQFVARGAYVTLIPRAIGTSDVLDFDQGRKGAIFLPMRTPGRHAARMEFIVVRAASVRALEQSDKGQVLASGNVFNRKRTPDLVLRLDFSPPGG